MSPQAMTIRSFAAPVLTALSKSDLQTGRGNNSYLSGIVRRGRTTNQYSAKSNKHAALASESLHYPRCLPSGPTGTHWLALRAGGTHLLARRAGGRHWLALRAGGRHWLARRACALAGAACWWETLLHLKNAGVLGGGIH